MGKIKYSIQIQNCVLQYLLSAKIHMSAGRLSALIHIGSAMNHCINEFWSSKHDSTSSYFCIIFLFIYINLSYFNFSFLQNIIII
jgi:hypothetical protein